MRALFFLLGLGLLIFSCKEDDLQGSLIINDVNKIRFQETLIGESISIQFLEVTEDSRCPTNVNCIWAGTAAIEFVFMENSIATSFEVFLPGMHKLRSDTTLSDYRIEIVSLEPYPTTFGAISSSDYVAEILVEKSNSLFPNKQ